MKILTKNLQILIFNLVYHFNLLTLTIWKKKIDKNSFLRLRMLTVSMVAFSHRNQFFDLKKEMLFYKIYQFVLNIPGLTLC